MSAKFCLKHAYRQKIPIGRPNECDKHGLRCRCATILVARAKIFRRPLFNILDATFKNVFQKIRQPKFEPSQIRDRKSISFACYTLGAKKCVGENLNYILYRSYVHEKMGHSKLWGLNTIFTKTFLGHAIQCSAFQFFYFPNNTIFGSRWKNTENVPRLISADIL